MSKFLDLIARFKFRKIVREVITTKDAIARLSESTEETTRSFQTLAEKMGAQPAAILQTPKQLNKQQIEILRRSNLGGLVDGRAVRDARVRDFDRDRLKAVSLRASPPSGSAIVPEPPPRRLEFSTEDPE